MRFMITGAGALDGYYGGCCSRAAPTSPFWCGRGAAQPAECGLVVRRPDSEFRAPVTAVQAGDLGGPYDVVVLGCKSYDLDSAIDDFAPALAADGVVLPVLNGVKHVEALGERLRVTQFSVVRRPDGEINVPGVGNPVTLIDELGRARSPRCEAIAAALAGRRGDVAGGSAPDRRGGGGARHSRALT